MSSRRKRVKKHVNKEIQTIRNPVARYAVHLNRCHVFRDKTRYNRRAAKQSLRQLPIGKSLFPMGSCLLTIPALDF